MKTFITSAFLALGIMASLSTAHAAPTIGDYQGVFAEALDDNF